MHVDKLGWGGGNLLSKTKKKKTQPEGPKLPPMLPDPKSANRECDISRSVHKERVETGKVVLHFDMFDMFDMF